MSDNERARDGHRDRGSRREARGGRDRDRDRDHERSNTGSERRNRSRSPRHERGGRRDGGRYRSRSPPRRDERDSRGRGDGNDGGRNDRGAPTGPRSGGGPRGPPLHAPRALAKSIKPEALDDEEEAKDTVMQEARARPEGMDEDTWEMAQVMGFAGFKSTKNTKVPGNDKNFGVRKDKQMEARQYMNRPGGFNRPLSPGRV